MTAPDGPMRSRSADGEQGQRRDRERPPLPEPLPHSVVDNHCHLDIADGDWLGTEDAISRAAEVGVRRIVQIGCDLPGAAWAVRAAEEETGTSRKDAIRAVATRAGLPKRTVYDVVHGVGEQA